MLHDSQLAEIKKAVAASLRQRREELNLSKNGLAQKAGISVQSVAFIEDGVNSPSISTFLRICAALDADAASILAEALRSGR